MKYFLIFLILNSTFCLKAKKSPFDLSKPSFGMIGLIFVSLNRTSSGDTTPPTVTVTNLKSKGTIDAGSLIGTASDNVGVATVEIQINNAEYAQATTLTNSTTSSGTKDWTYKIPTTTKWTYAFTNTINVRVKDTSGNTTISALTSIQKGENRDINGDGFVDLVISAPTYNANQGRVYVFNGSATGISQTSAASASQIFTGTAGRNFGSSLAMMDINGDGFADLVVCEYFNVGTNSAYYYLGSSSGFTNRILIAQFAGSEYCTSMAVGDFNQDSFSDVAISDVTSGGNIYIYQGNSTGLNTTPTQTIAGASNLGLSLATGDINGDGKIDLVARTSNNPYINSYLSNGSTLISSTTISSVLTSQIILGDFNGDGKADLAVGEIGFSSNTGRVFTFLSNGSTLNTTPSQTIIGENTSYFFSRNLSAGDINQDGITDLIAGNFDFGGANEYGKVYFFYGCLTTGICKGSINASAADMSISGSTTLALQFGSSTRLIDINRDGFPDLLVGGPGHNNNGSLFIFKGTASGISSSYSTYLNASLTIAGEQNASNFGLRLY